jgi:hypothetical protein
MSGLLYCVGGFVVVVGAVLIGFGIPISEFSFGNTLINSGTMAIVGGFVVAGLGVVAGQLQRLTDALTNRAQSRASRPADTFEPVAAPRTTSAPGRIPFPPKPKAEAGNRELHSFEPTNAPSLPAEMPFEGNSSQFFAPTLRNPDEPPVSVEDEVSLSPRHPMAAPALGSSDFVENAPSRGFNGSAMPEQRQEHRHEPTLDTDWRPASSPAAPAQSRQPHTAYFDAMWPVESKPAKNPAGGDKAEPRAEQRPDLAQRGTAASSAKRVADSEAPAPSLGNRDIGNEARAVAILKSGVVDGMGYTLYVDGSIEAELPQGTLRFASINELRSHLENNA